MYYTNPQRSIQGLNFEKLAARFDKALIQRLLIKLLSITHDYAFL
jgi:hypothetical protein